VAHASLLWEDLTIHPICGFFGVFDNAATELMSPSICVCANSLCFSKFLIWHELLRVTNALAWL